MAIPLPGYSQLLHTGAWQSVLRQNSIHLRSLVVLHGDSDWKLLKWLDLEFANSIEAARD
jgi:hypothetical protein